MIKFTEIRIQLHIFQEVIHPSHIPLQTKTKSVLLCIPLIHEMARQSGAKTYFVARKGLKVYLTDPLCVDVNSITTQHEQHLYLSGADAALMRGKRILIVDDVISTGESLKALEKLVEEAGATVAGRMAVLAEGDAQERSDIVYLEKLPVFNADGTVKG